MPFFEDKNLWTIGDSIASGATDEEGTGGYTGIAVTDLMAQTHQYWSVRPANYALGGYTTADSKAGIDAALAARSDVPDYTIIHLGANDVGGVQAETITEADWKADMSYIIAAVHTKWADSKIYICPSYRYSATGEYDPGHATLWQWMNDLIALAPTYLFAGWDSKPIFEDHPELLADGLHPNHAGYVAMADALETVMGF